MKVGVDELKWRSIETFYPGNEDLTVKRKRVKLVLSYRAVPLIGG